MRVTSKRVKVKQPNEHTKHTTAERTKMPSKQALKKTCCWKQRRTSAHRWCVECGKWSNVFVYRCVLVAEMRVAVSIMSEGKQPRVKEAATKRNGRTTASKEND